MPVLGKRYSGRLGSPLGHLDQQRYLALAACGLALPELVPQSPPEDGHTSCYEVCLRSLYQLCQTLAERKIHIAFMNCSEFANSSVVVSELLWEFICKSQERVRT